MRRVFIANRGEIALRIIRACHTIGVEAVVGYSEADRGSLPVQLADRAICIGSAVPARSYLHLPNLLSAALVTGCDALHPGYGFLSEHPSLPRACAEVGITFVGPSAETMALMNDKGRARQCMREFGLPILPGTEEPLADIADALAVGEQIGYPVMIKALMGGGGRGMRVIANAEEMRRLFPLASAEAELVCGKAGMYIEKFLVRPRHVEIQILADHHGNVSVLGERECSLQRRHQKIMEEAPALCLTPERREKLYRASRQAIAALRYTGAGTLEFLIGEDGSSYFIEMNTRLQVEHGVSELVTGVDVVAWQLRVAAGAVLPFPAVVPMQGHAIECRITAENADAEFAPGSGMIDVFRLPGGPGVRIDTHVYAGYAFPAFYDSLLAKVMTHGDDRTMALQRMRQAMAEMTVAPLATTIGFHRRLLDDPRLVANAIHTGFIDGFLHSTDPEPTQTGTLEWNIPLPQSIAALFAQRRVRHSAFAEQTMATVPRLFRPRRGRR